MREWTIYLPLYCGVEKLEIGIMEDASILPPKKQTIEKPIVYYGPSITQGACASRPGNAYTHIVSRWLDANFINYGFGGNAKGEPELARIITSMDMSVLVIDYDYNAPNPKHLKATHEAFFKIIREKNPLLPIVFTTMAYYHHSMAKLDYGEIEERRDIIYETFDKAKMARDNNVYFKDGYEFFNKEIADSCTVDGIHPSDIGMLYMAKAVYPILKDILK
ncbi:SGNH/GDSL hydrolase family protein [Xylanivirga thermophila]|uniref:SGNH/GDSL hydrolase family protein n=1 Tax=Xylanivirga thermophila TaxID=2496273 RepID=UPI00101C010E|nr:SGNH/GDSL hydrolase family protein [Xylanivirga thermophila]